MEEKPPRLIDKRAEFTQAEIVKALLQNQAEENIFVRHYEETRLKITQMTITLSGLLIGALHFGNSQQHARLFGLFIVMLGVLGILISAKYTERADRHATLSRAYRRAASKFLGSFDDGSLERIHEQAAREHQHAGGVAGALHDIRARLFWIGIHICMVVLGILVALR